MSYVFGYSTNRKTTFEYFLWDTGMFFGTSDDKFYFFERLNFFTKKEDRMKDSSEGFQKNNE